MEIRAEMELLADMESRADTELRADWPPPRIAEPMEPVPYRVVSRRATNVDVVTLGLRPVDAATGLAAPMPGQFVMAWVFGVGEIPISISGVASDGSIELTVRSVGATSDAIVGTPQGGVLGIRGPCGTEWPVPDAVGRDVVVMAGGLGLAPLRLAIEALLDADPGPRSLHVLIGARQPDQLLFADEFPVCEAAGARVLTTVDAADRTWHGAVGTATELLDQYRVRVQLAFVCGPELMMMSAARALVDQGLPPDRVHVSLERNMHCGVAKCGRCQLGPVLLCRDGAVTRWDRVAGLMAVRGR
jgi:anaerobic sulfite reductase subunit B